MSFFDYLSIFIYFVEGIKVTTTISNIGASSATVINHYRFCKEVCTWVARSTMKPIGGPGCTIELDETFVKRKYGRGKQTWWEKHKFKIFGGVCRENKEIFVLVLPNLTKEAIWPMILEYCLPGSTIYTDGAQIYKNMTKKEGKDFGFNFRHHSSVNHSIGEYSKKDDETGETVSTNLIEGVWRWLKELFSTGHGCDVEDLKLAVYWYVYKRKFLTPLTSPGERLRVFLDHLKLYYPGDPNQVEPPRFYTPWTYEIEGQTYNV